MYEEVKVIKYLQEETKIHGSHSTLADQLTKLKYALNKADKRYHNTYDSVTEKACQVDEHRKYLLQETKDHVETLKDLQDEVVGLTQELHDSLQWTIQVLLRVCDRVLEQTKNFCLDAIISVEMLDMFQSTCGVTER